MKNVAFIRILLLSFLLSFTVMPSDAASKNKPDFAFPKTVIKTSDAEISRNLKTGNETEAIRSLLDLVIAQNSIGTDEVAKSISRIKEMTAQVKKPQSQALLNLLLAKIYQNVYQADKYNYDRRELPLTPLSADYNEWSGKQFRSVISTLCDKALVNPIALQGSPIDDYASLIEIDKGSRVYFPTLYDFVAYNVIDLREDLSEFSSCVGLLALAPRSLFIINPGHSPSSPEAQKILDTYAALLNFHRNNPAPGIFYDIQRINFVTDIVYVNLSDEADERAVKLLENLYNDYFPITEYSGDALIELTKFNGSAVGLKDKDIYEKISTFETRYPSFARINCLRNEKEKLSAKSVDISFPSMCSPGKEFEIDIRTKNIKRLTVNAYKVNLKDPNESRVNASSLKGLKPVASVDVTIDGDIPFRSTKDIKISLPSYGCYAIVPSTDVKPDKRIGVIRCTNLATGFIDNTPDGGAFVIDPLTGSPVGKALISLKNDRREIYEPLGTTDDDGFLIISNSNGRIRATKGQDTNSPSIYFYNINSTDTKWEFHVNGYTDLALYRPGDTVQWCAVVYEVRNIDRRISTGNKVDAILYNANSIAVDTLECTTDAWGRINGMFEIPKGELTGQYRVVFKINGRQEGARWFTVSDYKLPTYYVKLDKAESGVPNAGDVSICGEAVTYSGMKLSGITVQAVISASTGRSWYRTNEVPFCTLKDTTDVNGRFSMVLTKEMIANSPAPDGYFTAHVTATSLSGENREASTEFNVGKAYVIGSKIPDNIEVSAPVDLASMITVMSSEGKEVDAALKFELLKWSNDSIVRSGDVTSALNWKDIRGGRYSLKVYAPSLNADTLEVSELMLYRSNDKYSPSKSVLWSPVESVTADNNGKATINIFASSDNVHALYILSHYDNLLERKWIKLNRGSNRIEVRMPDDLKEANLSVAATIDFNSSKCGFDISRKNAKASLKIRKESFRDKLIPGQQETWTFTTLSADSLGVESAVILDMYNSALDAIRPAGWSPNFIRGYLPKLELSNMYISSIRNSLSEHLNLTVCSPISNPIFQTYNRPLYPVLRFEGKILYASRSVKSAGALSEAEVSDNGMLYESVEAAPRSAKKESLTNSSSADMVSGLEVTEDKMTESEEDEGSATPRKKNFEYRPAETPLAFFNPTLTTDKDGRMSFSFTVPNANTTWKFNALAYDKELTADLLQAEVMANKPIMVQPNLPRFLRCGDKVTVSATVMNNSDKEVAAEVVVEFFNPVDSKTVHSENFNSVQIPAGDTKAVSVDFMAPVDAPFIGYRIKASTEMFADGEQTLIPILPASTPVIETTPFYISPDSSDYTLRLPDYPKDSRITLQFCDNPTWYVVTALPGISAKEARTAPEAAAAIFSAAVADGILRTCPQVKTALKQWLDSDRSDSTLVSMLERNSDLKTFLLQATPWMLDARNDTERMQRLALLFDKSNIDKAYSTNIALLKKLQRSGGGWAWINQYDKASEWATETTLSILGRLNSLGFLPSDKKLAAMINEALGYIQKETEKAYAKYPKSDYTYYVTLLDLWPSFKTSSRTQSIIARVVQKQVAGWKKFTMYGKTEAALILHRHGYKPIARQILESLSQFAKTSPEKGMWWPIFEDIASGQMSELTVTSRVLEAYHVIDPKSASIDRIRQWLILQKEARDWGNGPAASLVAASILLTSPTWVEPAAPAKVFIGNNEIKPTETENTLGYFRTDISNINPSGSTLSIKKTELTPAWGAVYSQSVQIMADVKPASNEAVDIEKRLYRQVGDKWELADHIAVGDRVKIELLIHANRAMDYVAISDDRAACLEPVEQLPTPMYAEGICFYRENNDDATNIFISNLPKGTYLLSYEMFVNNAGQFASGIATIQSQYAPQLTAHSSGSVLTVAPTR